ncbi:helix-turn-helix domain-containing protein [Nocardia salmonicida]
MSATGLPRIGFHPPAGDTVGLEVISMAAFRDRIRDWPWPIGSPHRTDFHMLMLVTAGTLRHRVDFTGYWVAPGSWLWIRPGQVYQWQNPDQVDATMILFRADFLAPDTVALLGPEPPFSLPLLTPDPTDAHVLGTAAAQLAKDFSHPGRLPRQVHAALLHRLLDVVILRLAYLQGNAEPAGPLPEPYLRFRDAVEHSFRRIHRVEDYARELNFSVRTLTRSTQASVRMSAKDLIDRRLVLEAKRLLAHGTEPSATVAAQLGFASATHFGKFFYRHTGLNPIEFRATQQSPGHVDPQAQVGMR